MTHPSHHGLRYSEHLSISVLNIQYSIRRMDNQLVNFTNNIVTVPEAGTAIDKNDDKVVDGKKKMTKILKKDYVLNDMEALKKKLDNAKRKPEIEISGEAKDGSCVTIGLKTSLFEYFKSFLMEHFKKDDRISNVEPIQKVVAETNFHGEANVEYQLEVTFKIEANEHKVKILCFSTTCNIMVQNMGGKSALKSYFQNQHSAMFFASEFILSFGRAALGKCQDMDEQYIPGLKLQLKKMQELLFKNKKKTIKPFPKTVKCSSIKCRSTGNLDTKNTDKYAQCVICDGCEHFNCANIKEEGKMKYITGAEKFVCSSCFAKDPKKVAIQKELGTLELSFDKSPPTNHIVSVVAEVHSENELEVIETEEITLEESVGRETEPNLVGFWATDSEMFSCQSCSDSFTSSDELGNHEKNAHESLRFICKECPFESKIKSELDTHLNNLTKCEECTKSFHSIENLQTHIEGEHGGENLSCCDACSFVTKEQESLRKHIKESHKPAQSSFCDKCSNSFSSSAELSKHNQDEHTAVDEVSLSSNAKIVILNQQPSLS